MRVLDAVAGAYLLLAAQLEVLAAVRGLILKHRRTHQLSEVFVGSHHVGGEALPFGALGKRADHVVSLEILDFDHRDAVCLYNLLDDGHGKLYILGCGGAFRLIFLAGALAECRARRVEAHRDMRGVLLAEHLLEGVDKTEDGGGVETRLRHARHLYECIISAENQRIGVKEKKAFLFHIQEYI